MSEKIGDGNFTPVFDDLLDFYTAHYSGATSIIICCVYGVLWRNSRNPARICQTTQGSIANHLHLSTQSVIRSISLLEQDGFITKLRGIGYHIEIDFEIEGYENPNEIEWDNKNYDTIERRKEILKKTGGKCSYCGIELIDFGNPEHTKNLKRIVIDDEVSFSMSTEDARRIFVVDHFIPKSRGGSNNISNLVPACSHCNSKKSNKRWEIGKVGVQNDGNE